MRDMRAATTAILSPWMDDAVALVANGYFPGATYEFMVGHVAYEAARGGAIRRLATGGRIIIHVDARTFRTDADLRARAPAPPPPRLTGAYARYVRLVGSASQSAPAGP